jgi:predicted RNase H-like HicB family nuclease
MHTYIYPAKFKANEDGSYTVTYPDLPGCISEGKSLVNALHMAQAALAQWIDYLKSKDQTLPKASESNAVETETDEFVNLICVDIKDTRAVKRTVSLPKWMDDKVTESGLSLSRVLQDALSKRLE